MIILANLVGLQKLVNYIIEKHPELADDYISADHDKVYLPAPESEEDFDHLVEKAKEFGVLVINEEDSLTIYT